MPVRRLPCFPFSPSHDAWLRLAASVPLAWLLAATLPVAAAQPSADDTATPATASESRACVEVEVDGYRGLSYDCLSQQMTPPPSNQPPAADTTPSEAPLRQAPNQIGIPTPATLSNRMGNQLGHSITPQRPPRSPDAR
ncbi:hypothetical protein [Kerstersia gyiorum]|uniref:hypothetical protein n=1 Tax=Kerstersia gyiorum TaxID=206506 RepID=UPI000A5233E4|nr:hypothetical protein [Kerstersia gyiorum]MCP1633373.1 hypothetical protein [Kerstersia gyiorum]MCP1636244.1 hypothetical protein [Kerstersia gyiorum]MCP1671188.1 hypothetical protein [Kerstersia gyiorum]MCP1679154.1 hypothetical protein [Kerstersia gyiorum]MCP1681956.1 hypothetical protein [Kerstersia gyiorum]